MINTTYNLETDIQKYLFSLPKPHFSPMVKIKPSQIAGIGLTAERDILSGEIIAVELGPVVNREFISVIESLTGYECNLCIGWDSYILHAPLHQDYQGGYINHSCDPNTGLLANGIWCAMRDIPNGEEIACDYGTFETFPDWAMHCNCGSPYCRKLITSEDHKKKELRDRLAGWFAPYLRAQENGLSDDSADIH